MRRVEKPPGKRPACLDPASLHYLNEIEKNRRVARQKARGAKASYSFNRYKHDDVRFALEGLFHGKCAYCETRYAASQPVDIEHFRPKGRVSELSDFVGYWWLAADWTNLLPSCIDCNRARRQFALSEAELETLLETGTLPEGLGRRDPLNQGKEGSFPLADEAGRADALAESPSIESEQPYLINPCEPDYRFEECFRYDFSHNEELGVLILPLQHARGLRRKRAIQSILIYGLNRLWLRQARRRVVREIDFLLDLYVRQTVSMEQAERESPALHTEISVQREIVIDALSYRLEPQAEFNQMVLEYLRETLPQESWHHEAAQ